MFLQGGLRPRPHQSGYKQLCGFKNVRIRMDEALILLTLKVKQTLKLIALLLSDTQVGTKTNKQTQRKRNYIIYKVLSIIYIFFAVSIFI